MADPDQGWSARIRNWLLYGNFWISACALAACWQTHLLLLHTVPLADPYPWLVAGGTLALYSTHRLIGIRKTRSFGNAGRYRVIRNYRHHILLYGMLGAALAGGLFTQLRPAGRWALLGPALVSLLYVAPLFRGKRLRDLPLVKIFLIALAWSLLTVWAFAVEKGLNGQLSTWIMTAERMFFIFGITIPFDIRDLEVDAFTGVKTLPRQLGVAPAKRLAYLSLTLAGLLAGLQVLLGCYPWAAGLGLGLSLLTAAGLVRKAHPQRSDPYFTGWIDGTILLQFVLVLAGLLGSPYL